MAELIGYARCSTLKQDVEIQEHALTELGAFRTYIDEGLTGTKRGRPGLDKALAAVREGDTLVVTKLDRLARNTADAQELIGGLAERGVRFQMGGSVYDWNDPFSRMFLQMLAVFAEFEANLLRMRTREGMARASAQGKLKGRAPKLSAAQHEHLVKLHKAGDHSISELAGLFKISRAGVYRAISREGKA